MQLEENFTFGDASFRSFLIKKLKYRNLKEFVYLIDALHSLSEVKGFKNSTILNNMDVNLPFTTAVGSAYKRAGIANKVWIITNTNFKPVMEEIIEYGYLNLLNDLRKRSRTNTWSFTLDGISYNLSFYEKFSLCKGFCIINLNFRDYDKNFVELTIPFSTKRLKGNKR